MVKTLNQKKYKKAVINQQSCLSKSSFELKGLCRSLVSSILTFPTTYLVFNVFNVLLSWNIITVK